MSRDRSSDILVAGYLVGLLMVSLIVTNQQQPRAPILGSTNATGKPAVAITYYHELDRLVVIKV
jgi:hypothetical protein